MMDDDLIMQQESCIKDLERACREWADVSQRNYQIAKKYRKALETIARPQYGLQSIIEDHPDINSVEYLEDALKYYMSLTRLYQKTAREAMKND